MKIEFFTRDCSRSCRACCGNWDRNPNYSEPYLHDGIPKLTTAEFEESSSGVWTLSDIDHKISVCTQIVPMEEIKRTINELSLVKNTDEKSKLEHFGSKPNLFSLFTYKKIQLFIRNCSMSCRACHGNYNNDPRYSEPYHHDGIPKLVSAEFVKNSMSLWTLSSIDRDFDITTQIVPIEEMISRLNPPPSWKKSALKVACIFFGLALASYFKFHCWPKNAFTYFKENIFKT